MRHALTFAALLLAGPALADTTYVLDKITITGSRTVPTADLQAVLHNQAGGRASRDDIVADQTAISTELSKHNVTGGIKTQLLGPKKNGHYEVTYIVEDHGAVAPTVTHVAPKLHAQIFEGNTSIPSETLATASGLTPGQDLTNDLVANAQKAILAAYKAAKLPVNVSIGADNRPAANGTIDVVWHVVETKAKKKRNTEDEGGQKLDQ